MADLHTYKKLPSDPCLTEEQILAYIDGKLSVAEQHACEKHILDCEMCEDAVEGITLVKDRSVLAAPVKTDAAPTEGKVVPLQQPRRIMYALAAVLVLVLGAAFIMRMMNDGVGSEEKTAQNNAMADSTVLAPPPGDGIANLESEKKSADSQLQFKSPEESMLRQDARGEALKNNLGTEGPTEAPKVAYDREVAPEVVQNETTEDIVAGQTFDQTADGADDGDFYRDEDKAVTKTEAQTVQDQKVAEEKENKKTLLDFAKDGIASGTAQRAEQQQKSKYTNDNRSNTVGGAKPDVSNAPQTPVLAETVTYNTQPNAGYVNTDTTAYHVTVTDANEEVAANDSIATDQLELSYQNGLKQLNAGQANNAIVLFDKVLADKNHARYEDAEFQKAKALIKANRKEEAKNLLTAIEAKKGKHAAEATELLKTL